jgi:hypothetical protein
MIPRSYPGVAILNFMRGLVTHKWEGKRHREMKKAARQQGGFFL